MAATVPGRTLASAASRLAAPCGLARLSKAVPLRGSRRVARHRLPPVAVLSPQRPAVAAAAPKGLAQCAVMQWYRTPLLTDGATEDLLREVQKNISPSVAAVDTEQCFNVALSETLTDKQQDVLLWLLSETYEPEKLTRASSLTPRSEASDREEVVIEVGPRLSFSSAWSANALSICASVGLTTVRRLERSRRYRLRLKAGAPPLTEEAVARFAAFMHDRMTEAVYASPLRSFALTATPAAVTTVPVLAGGRAALEAVNTSLGLAFDEFDLDFYTTLFTTDLKRDPTTVELFDIAQSNSEHSRHWFFKGRLVIDGETVPEHLFDMVRSTLTAASPSNSVIGFHDNSSAIRGGPARPLLPMSPGEPSPVVPQARDLDLLFTAETHNFPCAVAPYPGAETGAGGRIRDTHATGRGSLVGSSTAGYCVGNLQLTEAPLGCEDPGFSYPPNLAPPLQILLDASDGASDYGNKFGEPLIQGFTRTFGLRLPSGERREWLKPIMFSGGMGQIDHRHLTKDDAKVGMLVIKLGGPAYRIGLGGGAASSMTSGANNADLDFNAVQRGDAEMAQKLNRVVRTCVELGDANPILSIHDQGAGGNCNVVKEIIYPGGADIDIRAVHLGDETLSVLEIWSAEYQENDALLVAPASLARLTAICARERCPLAVIGTISGSGRVRVLDSTAPPGTPPAEDLELAKVLGDMPQKTYVSTRLKPLLRALVLPGASAGSASEALARVLRLPAVGSKRFLTNKVDRSVTGLVARQQCVGPLLLPLSDVAVTATAHTGTTGGACAIGEQPLKGLISPAAGARMSLGEALTNLVWARVTGLWDVKASGNWMWAAKLPHEAAALYDACAALRDAMIVLGVAVDGGKDSLTMAARAGGELVKAPGQIVVSVYCTCPDITATITPDLKLGDAGRLLLVDLARGRRRLGGSALAHAYGQLGDESPDMDDPLLLKRAFEVTQSLAARGTISAGHDVSDGGLAVALLEMAFAGNCGIEVRLPVPADGYIAPLAALFAEELGLVLEVHADAEDFVRESYEAAGVPCLPLGRTRVQPAVKMSVGDALLVQDTTPRLRDVWEETSFALERLQAAQECTRAEQAGLRYRRPPAWNVPWAAAAAAAGMPGSQRTMASRAKVAVLREEGSNGDREMAAALHAAGLAPWDVTVSDLLAGRVDLSAFRGLVFVGGFSYADVLDSAKGWAAALRFNAPAWAQLRAFYARPDTFSLGVCNGCQLMALLGLVPFGPAALEAADGMETAAAAAAALQPRFVRNASGRFESRFTQVRVMAGSPAIMLKGMDNALLGCWLAHGEGRALFPGGPGSAVRSRVLSERLAPLRYVDDLGEATEHYPFNPNGSPDGIAALCSPDGRHLAMMPHPERTFLSWQLPYAPAGVRLAKGGPGPWLRLFENAAEWCDAKVKPHS